MGLPDLDDMDYDPAGTYQKLSGMEKPDATSQDCMSLVMEMVTNKLQQLCKVQPESSDGRQTFTYIETDFIRALKHGYLVELQEPTTIIQPGVLVGLNSLFRAKRVHYPANRRGDPSSSGRSGCGDYQCQLRGLPRRKPIGS